MKPLMIAIIFCSALGLYPTYGQEDLVAIDEKPDVDFEEYQTYNWTSEAAGSNTLYTLNDAVLKTTIKDAIQFELDARGYEMEGSNADILINFMVFDEPTKFPGFADGPTPVGADEVLDPDTRTTYQLKEGTLLIQMLDKDKGTVIWQGYASGIMDGEVFDRSPERIRDAVERIFNKYEYQAY